MKRITVLKRALPTMLTVTTIVGVVAVAYISSQDTVRHIEDEARERPQTLTEKTGCYVRSYWRTGVACALTIASAIGSRVSSAREAATLMAGAVALENRFSRYRDKVKEKVGDDLEEYIYIEAFEPHVELYPDLPNSGEGSYEDIKLFYDAFLERYFWSTDRRVHDALYYLNRSLVIRQVAFLSEYCYFLGLEFGDTDIEMGWTVDEFLEDGLNPWIDYKSPVYDETHPRPQTKDGREYTVIYPAKEPSIEAIRGYL